MIEQRDLVTKEVREQLIESQRRMKKYEDRKVTPRDLAVGDIVKLQVRRRKNKGDWEYGWTGPYRLLEMGAKTESNVLLGMKGGVKRTYNRAHIAKYFMRDDEVLVLGQVDDPPESDME